MLAASILALAVSIAACEREPVRTKLPEPVHIAVDVNGKITLNGEPVPLEQLEARLKKDGGSILVETDAVGNHFVSVNDRTMTLKEYRAFAEALEKGGTSR